MTTQNPKSRLIHGSSVNQGCIFFIKKGIQTMNNKNVRLPIIAVTEQDEESIPYTDCEQILSERFSSIENQVVSFEDDSQDFVILVVTKNEKNSESYPECAIWIQLETTLADDKNPKYRFKGNFSSRYFDVEYSYDAESGVEIPNYVIVDVQKKTN